jgi:hypothetical protein
VIGGGRLSFYMACWLSCGHDDTKSRLRNHLWLSRMVSPESHIGFFYAPIVYQDNTIVYIVQRLTCDVHTKRAPPYVTNDLNHCYMVPNQKDYMGWKVPFL